MNDRGNDYAPVTAEYKIYSPFAIRWSVDEIISLP